MLVYYLPLLFIKKSLSNIQMLQTMIEQFKKLFSLINLAYIRHLLSKSMLKNKKRVKQLRAIFGKIKMLNNKIRLCIFRQVRKYKQNIILNTFFFQRKVHSIKIVHHRVNYKLRRGKQASHL